MSKKLSGLSQVFGAFVIALVLWQFVVLAPLTYPLRLFVTFIHELGHGTMALATGGEFVKFEVNSNGAGLATFRGGIRPIVYSAGYLGTAIFGAVLLYVTNASQQPTRPRRLATGLGISFVVMTLVYSGLGWRNFNLGEWILVVLVWVGLAYAVQRAPGEGRRRKMLGLGAVGVGMLLLAYFAAGDNFLTVLVGVLSGIFLIGLGRFGQAGVIRLVLNFLAFAVGLNAITDAWGLFNIVTNSKLIPHNDASAMADVAIMPAAFWAGLWILVAVCLLGGAIWLTFIRRKNEDVSET